MNALPSAAVLRAGGTAFVLDLSGPRPPRILHWGADLGPLTEKEIAALAFGRQSWGPISQLPSAKLRLHSWVTAFATKI
jgi:hypothetical protein